MRIEVAGPLLFWFLMFAVAKAIKFAAFGGEDILLELPPDAALWGTGILFSLAVSEQSYFGVRLTPTITRHDQGTGYSVQYAVTIPGEMGFSPKFIYLFLIGIACWIFCILLCGYGASGGLDVKRVIAIIVSFFLAALVVGTALRTLYEVTK